MVRWTRGLACVLVGASAAGSTVTRSVASDEPPPTPLREVESVAIREWKKGWFAFALPVVCEGSSLYFRFTPGYTDREVAAASAAGRTLSFGPRNVTRIS